MKNSFVKIYAAILLLLLSAGCTYNSTLDKTETRPNSSETTEKGKNGEKIGVASPDGKWVAITTVTRNCMDTVILDTKESIEYPTGVFNYITKNAEKYEYKLGSDQKPDPYIDFVEWCPDSKKVLLSYSFTDNADIRQTGVAVFNLEKMSVEWLIKLAQGESQHTEISKPEGFNWVMTDYGIADGLVAKDNAAGENASNR